MRAKQSESTDLELRHGLRSANVATLERRVRIDRRAADELLTVAQAAERLGIRTWTLRHWVCDGKIDVVKYGNGLVRIRRSVLERFIATCTIRARHHHGR